MNRTPKEWAELFSQSLQSTNPVTIEHIVKCAMDEAVHEQTHKTLNKVRETLLRGPYFVQPEIVQDIIAKVGE